MVASDAEKDLSPNEQEYLRWTTISRQTMTLIRWAILAFTLLTLYIMILNAISLYQANPSAYHYEVIHSDSGSSGSPLDLMVRWHRPQGGVHPVISLRSADGVMLTLVEEGTPIHILPNQEYVLELVDLSECTPGRHVGAVVLNSSDEASALPEAIRATTIDVEIIGGLWANWRFVGWWLVIASVLGLVVYGAALMQTPPTGTIVFRRAGGSRLSGTTTLRLSPRPLSYLLPWKRSSLPLRYVMKLGKVGDASGIDGEILFIMRGLPVLLVPNPEKSNLARISVATTASGREERVLPLQGTVTFLWGGMRLRYTDRVSRDRVDIRYLAD